MNTTSHLPYIAIFPLALSFSLLPYFVSSHHESADKTEGVVIARYEIM